jgi:hypothetical protein
MSLIRFQPISHAKGVLGGRLNGLGTSRFGLPPEVRRVIYTTNSIESLNYQMSKFINTRGQFPNDARPCNPSSIPARPRATGL